MFSVGKWIQCMVPVFKRSFWEAIHHIAIDSGLSPNNNIVRREGTAGDGGGDAPRAPVPCRALQRLHPALRTQPRSSRKSCFRPHSVVLL